MTALMPYAKLHQEPVTRLHNQKTSPNTPVMARPERKAPAFSSSLDGTTVSIPMVLMGWPRSLSVHHGAWDNIRRLPFQFLIGGILQCLSAQIMRCCPCFLSVYSSSCSCCGRTSTYSTTHSVAALDHLLAPVCHGFQVSRRVERRRSRRQLTPTVSDRWSTRGHPVSAFPSQNAVYTYPAK
ncbi:hypothetical protein BD289DRAFT_243632 [Coniella lustricola]|uniref:Uncharacterized protein n=1 Tax=Coniella lustricola TaxID=2025994 RepID=A0A2T3A988_9PEZI|nr:hypothetical protein BD289DRAFT_243632 [Coniella lustricola]